MQPLRYSINVTLDGCCDHRAGIATEDLHRHAAENIARAEGGDGFATTGGKRGDVDEACDAWVVTGFGDHDPAV